MDSIADMLIRIGSALNVKRENVDIPHSRLKEEIAKLLLAEGYVGKLDVHTRMNKKYLRLALKPKAISSLRRVSTPGRRIYVGSDKVPRVHSGFGTAIISTSKGLMTDETAREQKLGGEVICYIW